MLSFATGTITLTSKLGTFTFDNDVILSRAKLLRDCVTGQFFNPNGGRRIKTELDAQTYAGEELDRVIAAIPFNLFINPVEG